MHTEIPPLVERGIFCPSTAEVSTPRLLSKAPAGWPLRAVLRPGPLLTLVLLGEVCWLAAGHFDGGAGLRQGIGDQVRAAGALVLEGGFWQAPWWRAGLVLLAFVVWPLVYWWRMRQLDRGRLIQETFARQLLDSQEAERQRIAAELHDSLGQNLLVIKNRAAIALKQQEHPDHMSLQLQEVAAIASATIREMREIAQNLRPFQLDTLGLTQAIAAMARKLANSSAIDFETDLEPIDGALAARAEICLFRVVQECLNNVVKHSGATGAIIRTRRQPGAVQLTVFDNGCGFDRALAQSGHGGGSGLRNITERARALGAVLTFHSAPGQGTRVEMTVPVT